MLVVRHENEISGTTDVADRPEFADRRTTKTIDGAELTGWFTEDFTWDELSTLRCRERLPKLRPSSASFDDEQPVLRLRDVLDLVRAASLEQGRELGVVLEIKHATYFAGLGWDFAALIDAELRDAGWAAASCPSRSRRSSRPCCSRLRERGIRGDVRLSARGRRSAVRPGRGPRQGGADVPQTARPAGLDRLVGVVDGISVDKRMILAPDKLGRMTGPSPLIADAHARGPAGVHLDMPPRERVPRRAVPRPRRRGAHSATTRAEWAVIRDAGIDGVFVDHADLGVAFFRG